MIKQFMAALLVATSLLFIGCTTNDNEQNVSTNQTNSTEFISFGAFNDESYVWESYIFTTNRVINQEYKTK